jgi:protein CMS1
VGTPDRISKLLTFKDDEGLKLDRLKFLILDLTWLDAKGFNMTELPDSTHKAALWKSLLGLPKTLERFQSGQTKIVLF